MSAGGHGPRYREWRKVESLGGRGSLLGWDLPGVLLQVLDLFTQRSNVLERERGVCLHGITEDRFRPLLTFDSFHSLPLN